MFKRTKISAGALLAMGMFVVLPTMAQDTAQRVEITGSNIRRTDAETASPVQVITKQEIEQSGKGTVAEYLRHHRCGTANRHSVGHDVAPRVRRGGGRERRLIAAHAHSRPQLMRKPRCMEMLTLP